MPNRTRTGGNIIIASLHPGSTRRNTRSVAVAGSVFAAIACNAQTLRADALLYEVVGFNGDFFFLEQKVSALVLGIVRNGEISIAGFGVRAGKGSTAPDADSVIRIGSITKAFTGEALSHRAARSIVQLAQPCTCH